MAYSRAKLLTSLAQSLQITVSDKFIDNIPAIFAGTLSDYVVMGNFGSRILSNAVSSLTAQQALIATTGNNIANVNTDGYVRRTLELEARSAAFESGVSIGNGVIAGDISRQTNEFLNRLVQQAQGNVGFAEVEDEYLSRLEQLFPLNGEATTIGDALSNFFAAANDLTINPASVELRSNFIEMAEDLVSTISSTFNSIATLQQEADQRIETEINTVNGITAEIAELNALIQAQESTGRTAADERDKRTLLLEKLASKIDFSVTEASDGGINVYLERGFALVAGANSNDLEISRNPSFIAGTPPPALNGGQLGYITFDYSGGAGTGHIDLTPEISRGNGTIAGLLKVRGTNDPATDTSAFDGTGTLIDIARRVEAIAETLLTEVNQSYLGPDRRTLMSPVPPITVPPDAIDPFIPSSGDLNGNTPAVFGLFTASFGGSSLVDNPALLNAFPDTDDLNAFATTNGVTSYASILQLSISDPAEVAAALDATDPIVDPVADPYSFPVGDGQNMERLASLQDATRTFSDRFGNLSLSANFGQFYDTLVGEVGNDRNRSKLDLSVAEANLSTATISQQEVNGVSLDEEFANLIKFQRAFEASARMVRIADELLQQIVSII